MKRRVYSTIWAIVCTLLLLAGETVAFFFAWKEDVWVAVTELVCFVLGCVLAPIVHECGHIFFAKKGDMQVVYSKFSFLKLVEREGKLRLRFASPFADEQTQVLFKTGGDAYARARSYTLGGLVFSGIYLLLLVVAITLLTLFAKGYASFAVAGLFPYAFYLFLLNVLPCEYGSGKTDARVYQGMKKDEPAEKTMLACMEIQGELFVGKSYGEIEKAWYFDLPQLPEDEPLYAVLQDLRYRYYLDIGELRQAADCLNRLANAQAYLSDVEMEKVAAELVYMHALNGDTERAEACAQVCSTYLQSESLSAKRILATVACYAGRIEDARILQAQAQASLQNNKIVGDRRLEEKLLARLPLA